MSAANAIRDASKSKLPRPGNTALPKKKATRNSVPPKKNDLFDLEGRQDESGTQSDASGISTNVPVSISTNVPVSIEGDSTTSGESDQKGVLLPTTCADAGGLSPMPLPVVTLDNETTEIAFRLGVGPQPLARRRPGYVDGQHSLVKDMFEIEDRMKLAKMRHKKDKDAEPSVDQEGTDKDGETSKGEDDGTASFQGRQALERQQQDVMDARWEHANKIDQECLRNFQPLVEDLVACVWAKLRASDEQIVATLWCDGLSGVPGGSTWLQRSMTGVGLLVVTELRQTRTHRLHFLMQSEDKKFQASEWWSGRMSQCCCFGRSKIGAKAEYTASRSQDRFVASIVLEENLLHTYFETEDEAVMRSKFLSKGFTKQCILLPDTECCNKCMKCLLLLFLPCILLMQCIKLFCCRIPRLLCFSCRLCCRCICQCLKESCGCCCCKFSRKGGSWKKATRSGARNWFGSQARTTILHAKTNHNVSHKFPDIEPEGDEEEAIVATQQHALQIYYRSPLSADAGRRCTALVNLSESIEKVTHFQAILDAFVTVNNKRPSKQPFIWV